MKYSKLWFMAEDDGGGGGGFEPDLTAEHEGGANDTSEGVAEVTPEAKPAFDPALFATQLGESVAKTLRESQPKPEPAKKELSPEEAKKLLNVWEPDDAWYAKYDNLETRKQAVAEQRDALIRQADTIAQMRIQQHVDALDAKYAPMVTAYQQQQQEAQQSRFDKSFPQLTDAKMRPVLTAAAQSITAEKKQFANEGDMFKEVATRAEAIIKQFDPNFKLSAASAESKSARTIPTTTSGAGGGGGRGGGADTRKVNVRDLLPGPTG